MSEEKDLKTEIKENARKDRAQLEKLRDSLLGLSSNPVVQAEGLAMIGVAEQVTAISDSLSKVNMQLIELAKLELKKEFLTKKQDPLDKSATDALFDEIQGSMEN